MLSEDRKTPKYWYQIFLLLNTSYGFEYQKNCISKLSIKMFIKRKTRTGKAYAYRHFIAYNLQILNFLSVLS